MKHQYLLMPVLAGGLLAMTGCTKEPTENLSGAESRIYITTKDSGADFSSFKTFSLADSITVIENNQLAGHGMSIGDQAFINAVKDQMQLRGYALVAKSQTPDLGINISKIYNTYTGVVSYQDYWGGYNGFYDPYYWGYGGMPYYFPTYYDYYQVTDGAMSVDILNLRDATASNQIKGLWQGLIRGSGAGSQQAEGQAKALFEQSPYIKSNQ